MTLCLFPLRTSLSHKFASSSAYVFLPEMCSLDLKATRDQYMCDCVPSLSKLKTQNTQQDNV
jgi:hypothetical protein